MSDDEGQQELVVRKPQQVATRPPMTPEMPVPDAPDLTVLPTYGGIGELASRLGPQQMQRVTDILTAPIPVERIDIKPTGELYAAQIEYRRRLLQAFGAGGWGLRPLNGKGPEVVKESQWQVSVMWPMELVVHGVVVAVGTGEGSYSKNNPRATLATAAESAKSDSLVRACKDLGIATECWDKRWCLQFQKEHCVQVYVIQRGKKDILWRRKDADPFPDEKGIVSPGERPPAGVVRASDAPDPAEDEDPAASMRAEPPAENGYIDQEDIKRLMARCHANDVTEERLKAHLLHAYTCRSRKQVRRSWLPRLLAWVEAGGDLP